MTDIFRKLEMKYINTEEDRHKREYLKGKINELTTNSKNKNIGDLYRGINEFKRGHQPRSNFVKNKNGSACRFQLTN
jgi:hypothetical protein